MGALQAQDLGPEIPPNEVQLLKIGAAIVRYTRRIRLRLVSLRPLRARSP
jgi:hypothetical protein